MINDTQKIYRNTIVITCLVLIQMLNEYISLLTFIGLMVYLLIKKDKELEVLMISFLIFFLNFGVFKLHPYIGELRWILLIICILKIFSKVSLYTLNLNKNWIMILIFWTIYNIITSVLNSSNIVISIFKILLFSVSFGAITLFNFNKKGTNYKSWIISWICSIIIISIFFISSPIGYFVNGSGFQGIWNQPNGFSTILVISLSILIYIIDKNEYKMYRWFILINIILGSYMLYITDARGGIISYAFILVMYFVYRIKLSKDKMKLKAIVFAHVILIIISSFLILYSEEIKGNIQEILYKSNGSNIFYSSETILNNLINDIKNKPILGNGFGVDSNNSTKKYKTESGYTSIEKRNIVLAVWAESGVVGLTIFMILILSFMNIHSRGSVISIEDVLIVSVLMTNMTEMTFFSVNGIGIFILIVLSIYRNEVIHNNKTFEHVSAKNF